MMKRIIFSMMLMAGMYSLSSCEKTSNTTETEDNDYEMIDLMDHFYQREWLMKETYTTFDNKVWEDSCYIFFAERDTAFISEPRPEMRDIWKPVRYEIDGIKFQIFDAPGQKYDHPYYLVAYEDGKYILSAKYTDPYTSELTLTEKGITRSTEN